MKNCCTFEKLTESILSDYFGARFVHPFLKKAKISKWPKSRENRTNMDIILLFLATLVDKHDITPVHVTYPPLDPPSVGKMFREKQIWRVTLHAVFYKYKRPFIGNCMRLSLVKNQETLVFKLSKVKKLCTLQFL